MSIDLSTALVGAQFDLKGKGTNLDQEFYGHSPILISKTGFCPTHPFICVWANDKQQTITGWYNKLGECHSGNTSFNLLPPPIIGLAVVEPETLFEAPQDILLEPRAPQNRMLPDFDRSQQKETPREELRNIDSNIARTERFECAIAYCPNCTTEHEVGTCGNGKENCTECGLEFFWDTDD